LENARDHKLMGIGGIKKKPEVEDPRYPRCKTEKVTIV
jgi:hypothetical protein